jgi:inhibitor of KinA
MRIEPLGDQAAFVYCGDEDEATRLTASIRRAPPPWCVDVVQAYTSVAAYYEITQVEFTQVTDWLATVLLHNAADPTPGRLHVIPCCYEFGLDFKRIESHTGLSRDAIIELHTNSTYTVYAIGFCPGFPYLGYLPNELTGVPRLESPRVRVAQGSVGLTGRQTGIYTESRPGGWNIVGQTPLQLVDLRDEYFPLRTGDCVQFTRIDERDFRELKGERLGSKS